MICKIGRALNLKEFHRSRINRAIEMCMFDIPIKSIRIHETAWVEATVCSQTTEGKRYNVCFHQIGKFGTCTCMDYQNQLNQANTIEGAVFSAPSGVQTPLFCKHIITLYLYLDKEGI